MSTAVAVPTRTPLRKVPSDPANIHARRLFAAGCLALTTSAFTFVIRSDVLQDMGNAYGLSQANKGWLEGSVFLSFALSMLLGGMFADMIGFGWLLALAFVCHLAGVIGMVTAPPGEMGCTWLLVASLLMGCGNGLADAGATPLIATLFPERKTEYLNRLHAWFPAGLVAGGLASQGLHGGFGLDWRWSVGLILLPCLAYGGLILCQRFPTSQLSDAGLSRRAMYVQALRPTFLVLVVCAILAHGTEVAPQKWLDSVLSCTAGISGTLVLVYTSVLMFVMRRFAGPLAAALTAPGMLVVSATLAGVGLYLLSTAATGWEAFAFATIYGIGIGRLWPTLLGLTAERFRTGGAFVLALLGLAGNLSTSQVMPVMGHIFDHYAVQKLVRDDPSLAARVTTQGALEPTQISQLAPDDRSTVCRAEAVGAAMTYRWACVLPAVLLLVLVFGVLRPRPGLAFGRKPEMADL